jgi:hypothetical protein
MFLTDNQIEKLVNKLTKKQRRDMWTLFLSTIACVAGYEYYKENKKDVQKFIKEVMKKIK